MSGFVKGEFETAIGQMAELHKVSGEQLIGLGCIEFIDILSQFLNSYTATGKIKDEGISLPKGALVHSQRLMGIGKDLRLSSLSPKVAQRAEKYVLRQWGDLVQLGHITKPSEGWWEFTNLKMIGLSDAQVVTLLLLMVYGHTVRLSFGEDAINQFDPMASPYRRRVKTETVPLPKSPYTPQEDGRLLHSASCALAEIAIAGGGDGAARLVLPLITPENGFSAWMVERAQKSSPPQDRLL